VLVRVGASLLAFTLGLQPLTSGAAAGLALVSTAELFKLFLLDPLELAKQ
jgi:hypothetical protein